MSTAVLPIADLAETLFSRNRRAILSLLYGRPDEEFFLRQIVRSCGGGMGAVQRELQSLVRSGILRRTVRHKMVFFRAEPNCPIFEELKRIVLKTAGVADVLRAALIELGDRVEAAFIFGSVAAGRQNADSDVDLLVVGEAAFGEVVAALAEAQAKIGREINPVVYPPAEFSAKLQKGHSFLKKVMRGEKIFLMGEPSIGRILKKT